MAIDTQKINKYLEIGTTTITPHQILAGDVPFIIDAANYHGLGGAAKHLSVGRSGNVVYLDYNVTPTANGTMKLGVTQYKPHHKLMFACPGWTTERDKDRVIQVDADGTVLLLNAVKGTNYIGQVSYFTSL